jgi:hypothetical protein
MFQNSYERAKTGACARAILIAHPELEAGLGQTPEEMEECNYRFSMLEAEWYEDNQNWLPDEWTLQLYPHLAYLLDQ